ncbi:unnamed protein product [Alternaria alternata]
MPPKSLPSHPQVDKLLNAIDSATASRLRAVLKSLCVKDKANFAYVQDALLVQPGVLKRAWSEQDEDGDDDDDDEYESEDSSEDVGAEDESEYSDSEPNAPASRQRFEICIQCDKEYDVLQNHKRSCEWHDGSQEVDWDGDFWADHDERCHGTIDTEEMRKEYPGGFLWDCCDKPGDASGCKSSRHRPDRTKRVRQPLNHAKRAKHL